MALRQQSLEGVGGFREFGNLNIYSVPFTRPKHRPKPSRRQNCRDFTGGVLAVPNMHWSSSQRPGLELKNISLGCTKSTPGGQRRRLHPGPLGLGGNSAARAPLALALGSRNSKSRETTSISRPIDNLIGALTNFYGVAIVCNSGSLPERSLCMSMRI